jgi:hypothetical protein
VGSASTSQPPVGQEGAEPLEDLGVPGPRRRDLLPRQRDAPSRCSQDRVALTWSRWARSSGAIAAILAARSYTEDLVRVGQAGRASVTAHPASSSDGGTPRARPGLRLHRQVAQVEGPGHAQPAQGRRPQAEELVRPIGAGHGQPGIGFAHPGQQKCGVRRGAGDRAHHAQRVERVAGHQAGVVRRPTRPQKDAGSARWRQVGAVRERDQPAATAAAPPLLPPE